LIYNGHGKNNNNDSAAEDMAAFDVTPKVLEILPGKEASLFISFSPSKVGIYSGVLKLRSRKKVSIIDLLYYNI
jgi:hypothetical protein